MYLDKYLKLLSGLLEYYLQAWREKRLWPRGALFGSLLLGLLGLLWALLVAGGSDMAAVGWGIIVGFAGGLLVGLLIDFLRRSRRPE